MSNLLSLLVDCNLRDYFRFSSKANQSWQLNIGTNPLLSDLYRIQYQILPLVIQSLQCSLTRVYLQPHIRYCSPFFHNAPEFLNSKIQTRPETGSHINVVMFQLYNSRCTNTLDKTALLTIKFY